MIEQLELFTKSKSIPSINTIQYLGSKKELLDWIIPFIKEITPSNTYFMDLFAGTGSIGYAMSDSHKIISNDLQKYSYIINKSILNYTKKTASSISISKLKEKYRHNFSYLNIHLESLFKYEDEAFKNDADFLSYAEFCKNTPFRFSKNKTNDLIFSGLEYLIDNVEILKENYSILFVIYYGNTYFSMKQCAEIDSIRHAIEHGNFSLEEKSLYYTALMSTMSYLVSSTTHFAQPLKIKTQKNFHDITFKRKQSIWVTFEKKLNYLKENIKESYNPSENIVLSLDFSDALDWVEHKVEKPTTIYADPPYFKEHYSRYYHILETLLDYDYPQLTYNKIINDVTVGRYAENRKVSDFGKKKMALNAFNTLVQKSKSLKSNLCISYSDNSIVSLEDLIETCKTYYNDVKVHLKDYVHSNQGRSDNTVVKEALIICNFNQIQIKKNSFNGLQSTKDSKIEKLVNRINSLDPVVANPISEMHNYLAKKPFNVVSEIINSLTIPSDIVYDGFMGSGTTGYEALKLNRRFIGIDINVVSHNYFKAATQEVNLEDFSQEFEKIYAALDSSLTNLYTVPCPECGKPASLDRIFFDLNNNRLLEITKSKILCKHCYPKRKKGKFFHHRPIDQELYESFAKYKTDEINEFFNKPLLENTHIAIQKDSTISDYFCLRNKIALYELIQELEKLSHPKIKQLLYFVLSATLHLFKLSDHKASSQVPYWRPQKNIVSRNPFIFLREKFNDIYNGLLYSTKKGIIGRTTENLQEFLDSTDKAYLIHDSIISEKSKQIKNDTISLIITDPPYSDQVPYLEYTGLWDKVLNLNNLSEDKLSKEIVVSKAPSRSKDIQNFNLDMEKAILEMGRVLKENGYCCFFYHDFSLVYWKNIIKAANKANLKYITQCHIKSKQKSLKSVWTENKNLEGSALVFFKKQVGLKSESIAMDLESGEKLVHDIAIEIIENLKGEATSQQLYDFGVLDAVINNNLLEVLSKKYKTFITLFKKWFTYDEFSGKWTLPK